MFPAIADARLTRSKPDIWIVCAIPIAPQARAATTTNLAINVRMFINLVVAADGGNKPGAAASLSHTGFRARAGS